jgi:hypothetical protein
MKTHCCQCCCLFVLRSLSQAHPCCCGETFCRCCCSCHPHPHPFIVVRAKGRKARTECVPGHCQGEANDDEDEEENEAASGDDKRDQGAKGAEENAIFFPAAQETSEAEQTAMLKVLDQAVRDKKLTDLHTHLLGMGDHQFWIGCMEASVSRSPPSP